MGRPPLIDRDQVVDAALRLIDEEGPEALNIERIAREVGVRGSTLYHHFSDKAEIMAEAAKRIVSDINFEREATDWQDWMVSVSLTFHRRMQEHPKAAPILIRALSDADALPGMERAAELLGQSTIDPSLHLLLIEGTEKLMWGWALQRTILTGKQRRLRPDMPSTRWPALAAAVAAAEPNDPTDEHMLEASLLAFHAGVLRNHELATG